MLMRTPKFFYFDLGNVLLAFSHEQSARQVAELVGCSYEVAWDALYGNTNLEVPYETGLITSQELHAQFSKITGTRSDFEPFILAASAIFKPVFGTLPVVANLHSAGYPLGVLSNTCDGHWEYCLARFALLKWYFDVHCLSYVEKVMKPDPKIYQIACEKVGHSPEDVFFVDDRPDNVEAAKLAGMDVVHFITPHQLIRDLLDRGVRGNF